MFPTEQPPNDHLHDCIDTGEKVENNDLKLEDQWQLCYDQQKDEWKWKNTSLENTHDGMQNTHDSTSMDCHISEGSTLRAQINSDHVLSDATAHVAQGVETGKVNKFEDIDKICHEFTLNVEQAHTF
jgi:hypothetical protein